MKDNQVLDLDLKISNVSSSENNVSTQSFTGALTTQRSCFSYGCSGGGSGDCYQMPLGTKNK
ncbi:MAG TPA: hypothetical protein VIG73_05270 [Cerasibacillus sp.]|uniref:hypothetical protein n=1 Tax=Cerasibacillus sp. TaxID=2498711 RepID=UPI002F3F6954